MYTGNTNYGQTVTGTFNADATTLTINGHMYIPATQEDFNKAVAALCQNAYANGHNQVGGVCFGPTSTAPAPTATPTPTIQATPTTAPKPVLICQQDSTGQQTFCHYQGEQPGPNAVCYDVNGNPIQGVVYVGSPATPCVIPGH